MTLRPARALLRLALTMTLALVATWAQAYAGPDALRAKYGSLREQLHHNSFGREMYVNSSEAGNTLKGDVYAVLDYPFGTVTQALRDPADWCDIMMLPFNTMRCRAIADHGNATLHVRIGRRYDQPVQDAFAVAFALHQVATTPQYFESRLAADSGPVGTRDYRIVVAAVPLDARRTFMHLSYSYQYGIAGRMAMQAYFSTSGADKVGFTVTGRDSAGQPTYIGGVRGAIERTAMRYYLAIDADLATLAAPRPQRLERRIERWFAETEHYPRQLHEMDRSTYLALKRSEYARPHAIAQ